jgi:DNA-binding phage protein
MSTFRTTDKQKVRIYEIAASMKEHGLSDSFIAKSVKLAEYYLGAFDLLELWEREEDEKERGQIVADLQDEIDEFKGLPTEPEKKPYISYKDLELIAKDVTGFKEHLKTKVDQWGGISKLSRVTGIPQPSLSRFFNTSSMPRRTTLYKIAEALNLSEKEIITEWAA